MEFKRDDLRLDDYQISVKLMQDYCLLQQLSKPKIKSKQILNSTFCATRDNLHFGPS